MESPVMEVVKNWLRGRGALLDNFNRCWYYPKNHVIWVCEDQLRVDGISFYFSDPDFFAKIEEILE